MALLLNRSIFFLIVLSCAFSQGLDCNFVFSKKTLCVGETLWVSNHSIGGERFLIDFDEEPLEKLPYSIVLVKDLSDSIGTFCYSHRVFRDQNGEYFLVTGCGGQLTVMSMGNDPLHPSWKRKFFTNVGSGIRDIRVLHWRDSICVFLNTSGGIVFAYLFPDPFQPPPNIINFGDFGGSIEGNNGQDLAVVPFDTHRVAFYIVMYGSPSTLYSVLLNSLYAPPSSATVESFSITGLLGLAYMDQPGEVELWAGVLSGTPPLRHYHFVDPNLGLSSATSFPISVSGSGFPSSLYKGTFIFNLSPLLLRGRDAGNAFPLIRLQDDEATTADWKLVTVDSISSSLGVDFFRYQGNIYATFIQFGANSKYVLVRFSENHMEGDTLFTHKNPISHVYSVPDTYIVQCIAYNDTFGMDVQIDTIVVLPQSDGIPIVQNACAGQPAFFDFFSSDTFAILSYTWVFGDGDSAFVSNPSHVYASGGTYHYQLILQNEFGCQSVFVDSVQVHYPPDANFSYVVPNCANDSVQFLNQTWLNASDGLLFIRWDFGDGSISGEENPAHFYGRGGVFSVKLLVTSDKGCSDSITKSVAVPGISYSHSALCRGKTATFLGSAFYPTTTVTNTYWNLYQNGQLIETQFNTLSYSHLFPDTGVYRLDLVVTTQSGCVDTFSKMLKVYLKPNGNFVFDSIRCTATPIRFTAQSVTQDVPVTQYLWRFYDGTPPSQQSGKSVNHSFSSTGDFLVELELINSAGCDTTISKTVSVGTAPDASFLLEDSLCVGDSIKPINTTWSSTPITKWFWLLSDGSFSHLRDPIFTVTTPNAYTLSLVAYGKGNCPDTAWKTFTVFPSPVFFVSTIPDTVNAPHQLPLSVSTSSNDQVQWYVNDSLVGTGGSYLLTLNEEAGGIYLIRLNVMNEYGCVEQFEKQLYVNAAPPPYYDVGILDLFLTDDSAGYIVLSPVVQNLSNRQVVYLDWTLFLNQQNLIQFATTDTLSIGAVKQIFIPIKVQRDLNLESSYLCIEVTKPNHAADMNPSNNRFCKTVTERNDFLTIFPNPVDNQVTLLYSLTADQFVSVKIYGSDGKELFQREMYGKQGVNSLTISTDSLAPGIYFVVVKINVQYFAKPFIKQ
jgi:PKD repeat protein